MGNGHRNGSRHGRWGRLIATLLDHVGEFARPGTSRAEHDLIQQLDPDRLPRHIAVIMDGNGRWATGRGLPRGAGHRAGVHSLRETVESCAKLGIEVLTVYAFSTENWTRPAEEVGQLMELLVETIGQELERLNANGIRLQVIGRSEGLPARVLQQVRVAEERTRHNRQMLFNVALNYGGRAEIVDAVRRIGAAVRDGTCRPEAIDEDLIRSHLYTAGLPDPDLVIRTGGEYRLSNFLLWQVAYAELWVTPVLWPDFRRVHLLEAIVAYQHRNRRFGRV